MPRPLLHLPLRTRAQARAAVDEELEFHIEMVAASLVAHGWNEIEADAEARRRFGDLEYTRVYCSTEDYRREQEKRRMTALDELTRDLRYTFRTLRRSPGFTLIVLLTLALGIGANTAIFSVVRAVLLEPLPFPDADRIVRVWHANTANNVLNGPVSEPDYLDWKASAKSAATMGGFFFADGQLGLNLTGDGPPRRLAIAAVTEGFFETLRATPRLGRLFTPDDQLAGRSSVVILGHGLFTSKFGGDPRVIGRTILLDDRTFTVIGVMPEGFTYPANRELDAWVPLAFFGPDDIGRARGAQFLQVIARLAPGATEEQLRGELSTIAARLTTQYTDNPGWTSVTTQGVRESIVGDVERPLALLLGAVAFVLLITCVNVASLLLTRASARERELAVRAALGAGSRRITRQLLTESLTLALVGGALGVGIAFLALNLLLRTGATELPRNVTVTLDATVLGFTLLVSLFAGLLFGVLPTLRATGTSLETALRSGTRGSVGKSGGRLRNTLVIAQVALAVVLITAAGLTVKSLTRLVRVDLGFDPAHAIVVDMGIPNRYDDPDARLNYYESVLQAVRSVPGVTAVGSIRDLPLRGNGEARRPDLDGTPAGEGPLVQFHHISQDYFKAAGIKLLKGRSYTEADRRDAAPVIIINEAVAQRWFPGVDPIDKTMRMGNYTPRVIGVVADVRQRGPAEAADPAMYVHMAQQQRSHMSIIARTSGEPAPLIDAVRQAIWNVNKDQAISRIGTLQDEVGRAVARPRLLASLLVFFGLLGLTLGALGIYGVLAFAVNQRRQEIGVRVALGATPARVLRMVIGQGLTLSLIGVVVGIAGAAALAGSMQSVLYDVPAVDLVTFGQVVAVLLLAALVASALPARRALAIDPAVALRSD